MRSHALSTIGSRIPLRLLPLLLGFALTGGGLATAADPVSIEELDNIPRFAANVDFRYPDSLPDEFVADDVELEVVVGARGEVTAAKVVRASRPDVGEAARDCVQRWLFTAGISRGKPVAFQTRISVPFRSGSVLRDDVDEPPNPAFVVSPEHPAGLHANPRQGEAWVDLLVSAEGEPTDAVVVMASHPGLVNPAREAVLGWRFTAAQKLGRAVASRTLELVTFNVEDIGRSQKDRYRLAQFSYRASFDVSPNPRVQPPMVFPFAALLDSRSAMVEAAILVDPEGNVVRSEIARAPEPEFAQAARAALTWWKFSPAEKAGVPVYGLQQVTLKFSEDGDLFQFDEVTSELLAGLRAGAPRLPGIRQIDAAPSPTRRVEPVLPADLDEEMSVGEAVIEFIIDRNGKCQLPRVVSATNAELGFAAATAAAQWRFTPPRKDGLAVDVRARQRFIFGAEPPNPAGG